MTVSYPWASFFFPHLCNYPPLCACAILHTGGSQAALLLSCAWTQSPWTLPSYGASCALLKVCKPWIGTDRIILPGEKKNPYNSYQKYKIEHNRNKEKPFYVPAILSGSKTETACFTQLGWSLHFSSVSHSSSLSTTRSLKRVTFVPLFQFQGPLLCPECGNVDFWLETGNSKKKKIKTKNPKRTTQKLSQKLNHHN